VLKLEPNLVTFIIDHPSCLFWLANLEKEDKNKENSSLFDVKKRARRGHNKTEIACSPYPVGLRTGRTMVGQDWDTTAGLLPDKTGTRLPAYGRTRLMAYGQTRLPGKNICRTICRLDCRPGIAYQCDATQIDANNDATHNYPTCMTKFAINDLTCNHDEIRNN
jgi:hypothetical protein